MPRGPDDPGQYGSGSGRNTNPNPNDPQGPYATGATFNGGNQNQGGGQGGGGGGQGGGTGGAGGGGNGRFSADSIEKRVQRAARQGFLAPKQLAQVAAKGPQVGTPEFAQHVANQLGRIPWWQSFPDAAAYLSHTKLPTASQQALVNFYPDVNKWVDQNTSLGGVPGILKQAYTKALQIQDPAQKFNAVSTLNALRDLPQDQQSAVLAYIKGSGQYGTPALLAGMEQITGASSAPVLTTDPKTGKPIVSFQNEASSQDMYGTQESTGADAGRIAALESLVPSLKGRLHFGADGINFEDVQSSVLGGIHSVPIWGPAWYAAEQASAKAFGQHDAVQMYQDPKTGKWSEASWGHIGIDAAIGAATFGVNLIAPGFSLALAGATGLAEIPHELGDAGIGGEGTSVLGDILHYSDPFTYVNDVIGGAGNAFGDHVLVPLGLPKDQAEQLGNTMMVGVVALLSHGLSTVADTIREAPDQATLAANAAQGAEVPGIEEAVSTGRPTAAQTIAQNIVNSGGRAPSWLHPMANHIYPHVDAAIHTMMEDWKFSVLNDSGVADFLRTRSFKSLFDMVQKAKDKYPGDVNSAVQAIQSHIGFRDTSPDLIRTLVETDRAGMPLAAADHIIHPTRSTPGNVDAAEAALADHVNQTTPADLEIAKQRSAAATEAARAKVSEHQSTIDELKAQLRETTRAADPAFKKTLQDNIDQLKADIAEAEARQAESEAGRTTGNAAGRQVEDGINELRAQLDDAERVFQDQTSTAADIEIAKQRLNEAVDKAQNDPELVDLVSRSQEMAAQVKETQTAIANDPELADLHQAADEAKAKDLEAAQLAVPQTEIPVGYTLPKLLHRLFWTGGVPLTRIESGFKSLFTWGKFWKKYGILRIHDGPEGFDRQPWVLKWFDKVGHDNTVRAPMMAKTALERAKIMDDTTTRLNRLFTRLGMSQELQTQLIGKLNGATDEQVWRNVYDNEIFGVNGAVAPLLPKNMLQSDRDAILGTIGGQSADAWRGGVKRYDESGKSYYDPVASRNVDGTTYKLPVTDADVAGVRHLPNPDLIDLAVNRFKRASSRGGEHGAGMPQKTYHMTYELGRFMMRAQKYALMPPTLIGNFFGMLTHKLANDVLGNLVNPEITRPLAPRGGGFFGARRARKGQPAEGEVSLFGEHPYPGGPSAHEEAFNAVNDIIAQGSETPSRVNTRDALSNPELLPELTDGLFSELERHRGGYINQKLAQHGLGEDTGQWMADQIMSGNDPILTRIYESTTKPTLDKLAAEGNPTTLAELMQRQVQEIRDATFDGHPDYVNYVAHGTIPRDNARLPADAPTGLKSDYRAQLEKKQVLEEKIQGLSKRSEDPDVISALRSAQAALRTTIERLRQMQDFNADPLQPRLDFNHPDAIKNDIQRRVQDGTLHAPDEVRVTRRVTPYSKLDAASNVLGSMRSIQGVLMRMLKPITTFEEYGPRGAFLAQRFEHWEPYYKRVGLSPEDARAFSLQRAIDETADNYYDYAARSTMERSMRNLFWFMPVNAQLLYHWAYRFPAEQGAWLPGVALVSAKLSAYQAMAQAFNLVHPEPKPNGKPGETTLAASVPIAKFLNFFTGGTIKGNTDIPISGILTHVLGGVPTLSPLPAEGLQAIAPHVKAVEGISRELAPFYGASIFPSSVHSFLGIFGWKLPDMMPSYVDSAYHKTYDVALQYAWTSMYEDGDRQPAPTAAKYHTNGGTTQADFNEALYQKDWTAWFARLNSLANSDGKTLFAMKSLTGSIGGWYTSKEQQDYYSFLDAKVTPYRNADGSLPAWVQTQMNNYFSAHPESLSFSISTGKYTGKDATSLPQFADYNQQARAQYAAGIKETMSPDEFAKTLAGMTMKAFYEGTKDQMLRTVAGKGSVHDQIVNVLTNWGDQRQAYDDFNAEWDLYTSAQKAMNNDIGGVLEAHTEAMNKAYGQEGPSVQSQFMSQFMDAAFQLKENITPDAYKTATSDIRRARAELYQNLKQNNLQETPLEKGINWYFDNVLTPYFKEAQPIYNQIDAINSSNGDPSALYAQLATIKQKYADPKMNGQSMPSPDAFFYGEKTKTDQRYERLHWLSQPISYLTAFQRQTVGYKSFPNEDQFWTEVGAQKARTDAAIQARGYTQGSTQYDSTQAWESKQEQLIAQRYGPEAVAALQLDSQAPAYRLSASDSAYSQNATWNNVMKMVDYYNQQNAKQYAYGTKTQYMDQLKGWIYQAIQTGEASDDDFKNLMRDVHMSTTVVGVKGQPTGVPLYEAVFFGNFNTSFENTQLAQQYAPTGVW